MWQELFADYIPMVTRGIARSGVIFMVTLGIVYMLGRMLEIIQSDRGRNAVAIFLSFSLSFWSVYAFDFKSINSLHELAWLVLSYASGAVILFVLIGWRLFPRVNSFLDSRFAPDKSRRK